MPEPPLRLGLVGCSWFALRAHIPALLKLEAHAELRAVCSRTRKSMARAEAKIVAARPDRVVKRHAKMEAMFADSDIDCVLLVLPIPTMPAAVEAALRAGKHVLSEKPAAPSVETALHLLSVLQELGPQAPAWHVLENWQFKPSVRWLRERLQEGAIGSVVSAHGAHHHPDDGAAAASWRSSVPWLMDVGVHWARALRILLGTPLECSATLADANAAHQAHGWIRFEHCAAAVTISMSAGGRRAASSSSPPPSLQLHGERGTLCWWAHEVEGRSRVALERYVSGGAGGAGAGAGGADAISLRLEEDDWVSGGVAACLEHALASVQALVLVRRGRAPRHPPPPHDVLGADEALRDMLLVAALHRSHEARRVVAVDEALGTAPGLMVLAPSREQWDASLTRRFTPQRTVPCATAAEVGRAIALAASLGLRARPIGFAHSWSGSYEWSDGRPRPPSGAATWLGGGGGEAAHTSASASEAAGPEPALLAGAASDSAAAPAAEARYEETVRSAESTMAALLRDALVASGKEDAASGSDAGGVLTMRMGGMGRVLEIDVARRQVTVEPGLSLRELRAVLAHHDLTIGSWPMLLDQTVGGATVGAGAHGSAPHDGTMADAVVAMRLVDASGESVSLREADGEAMTPATAPGRAAGRGEEGAAGEAEVAHELEAGAKSEAAPTLEAASVALSLRAARVSLGLLGVAVSLTLQCEPRYYVRRHLHELRVDELAERAEALCAAYRHLWVWWALGETTLAVCALEEVGCAPAAGASRYDGENWYRGTPALVAPRAAAKVGGGSPAGPPSNGSTARGDEEDEGGDDAAGRARWVSMQYSFARPRLAEVLQRLTLAVATTSGLGRCAGRVVELKFVGAGRSLLGVNREGPVVCFNALWSLSLPDEMAALATLEGELVAMGGRPHLGKLHGLACTPGDQDGEEEFMRCVAGADLEGRFGPAVPVWSLSAE